MYFVDTETCGLTGPIVLIQYARDQGEPVLHEVWRQPVRTTLKLIETFCENDICAFNLSFDWHHLTKLYNVLVRLPYNDPPEPHRFAEILQTKPRKWCLRPTRALDLFLYARKTSWQVLMGRENVTIKKVPLEAAEWLAEILQRELPFPAIFFHRRSEGYKWNVELLKDDPRFANVVLKFGATGALKPFIAEIFKESVLDYPIDDRFNPTDVPFNPYHDAWLEKLDYHIGFWRTDKTARSYAENDILYLQRLHSHFGYPEPGDLDSELAVCVGAVRYHGYSLDIAKIRERYNLQLKKINIPCNVNSHIAVREYVCEELSSVMRMAVKSTAKKVLEQLDTPRAREVLAARKAMKELDVLSKLLECGRFCPEFKVIGTKSGRMSGGGELYTEGGSLNPQGINRDKGFRELFTLSDPDFILSGGDFKSFEVTLADAAYNDERLRQDLESGKSLHGLFGSILYDEEYDQIVGSKGTEWDLYTPAKNSVFGLFYGAHAKKIAETAGVTDEKAELSYTEFVKRYPRVGLSRAIIFDAFCSMRQPGGLGTEVIWKEPADYIESLLGFRRYYTLENRISRRLFDLARTPPKNYFFGSCSRRGRVQTIQGATQSALYAAAFNIQARNMRSAANHVIQSTGAQICKELQRAIWSFQPAGVHLWQVIPMNIHDEVMVVHRPEVNVKSVVTSVLDKFRPIVPLIAMDWKERMENWSQK